MDVLDDSLLKFWRVLNKHKVVYIMAADLLFVLTG